MCRWSSSELIILLFGLKPMIMPRHNMSPYFTPPTRTNAIPDKTLRLTLWLLLKDMRTNSKMYFQLKKYVCNYHRPYVYRLQGVSRQYVRSHNSGSLKCCLSPKTLKVASHELMKTRLCVHNLFIVYGNKKATVEVSHYWLFVSGMQWWPKDSPSQGASNVFISWSHLMFPYVQGPDTVDLSHKSSPDALLMTNTTIYVFVIIDTGYSYRAIMK